MPWNDVPLREKRDGFGDPIDPKLYYYIQDRRTFVGNCLVFWSENGYGYTCEFDEAGTFLGDDPRVHSDRETDVPWPVMAIRAACVTHVDGQKLYRLKKRA